MELFSIIIGNIRTFSFAKFVQFQENSAAIKVFFLFCSLKICLSYAYILTNFNLYMPRKVCCFWKDRWLEKEFVPSNIKFKIKEIGLNAWNKRIYISPSCMFY